MASFNAGYTLTDLLFSGVFVRFPDLKVCLAESQLGWIPYVLARADFVWSELSGEGFTGVDKGAMPEPPSAYFARNVWVTFFRDPLGMELIDRIGADRILYETDYPHTDTAWPECQDVAEEYTASLPEADAARVVATNAKDLFRVELD
jgi:predicted TIM-barrel fold metal-dependent hydrolase